MEVADRLRGAVASGLLPFEELEPRLDAAYSATSVEELERLVRWLPTPHPLSGARERRSRTRAALVGVALAVVAAAAAVGVVGALGSGPTDRPRSSPVTAAPIGGVTPPTVTPTAPSDAGSAIVSIDEPRRVVTVQDRLADVAYRTCTEFEADAADGRSIGLAGLRAGDFARIAIDADAPCIRSVSVVPPTSPPDCAASGLPSSAVVRWKGFNRAAHSVLYLPSGPGEPVLAMRWCETPTVVDTKGAASTLERIPRDAEVELRMSDDGFVTSVTIR